MQSTIVCTFDFVYECTFLVLNIWFWPHHCYDLRRLFMRNIHHKCTMTFSSRLIFCVSFFSGDFIEHYRSHTPSYPIFINFSHWFESSTFNQKLVWIIDNKSINKNRLVYGIEQWHCLISFRLVSQEEKNDYEHYRVPSTSYENCSTNINCTHFITINMKIHEFTNMECTNCRVIQIKMQIHLSPVFDHRARGADRG